MTFEAIDLTRNGNIKYLLRRWARDRRPFLSIIHAAFSGHYRPGSAGAPDAHHIDGVVRTVGEVWHPNALILDLSDLQYTWGDEMDLVLTPPIDIAAVVVSPKCEPAISTLFYGVETKRSVLDEPHFFDAIDPAIDYVRQSLVADWNSTIERHAGRSMKGDPISIDDLR